MFTTDVSDNRAICASHEGRSILLSSATPLWPHPTPSDLTLLLGYLRLWLWEYFYLGHQMRQVNQHHYGRPCRSRELPKVKNRLSRDIWHSFIFRHIIHEWLSLKRRLSSYPWQPNRDCPITVQPIQLVKCTFALLILSMLSSPLF